MPRGPRSAKYSPAYVIGVPLMGGATMGIEDVTDKAPSPARGKIGGKNELKSSQRPNEVLLLATQPFAAGPSAIRFFTPHNPQDRALYDAGVHNCSRNRLVTRAIISYRWHRRARRRVPFLRFLRRTTRHAPGPMTAANRRSCLSLVMESPNRVTDGTVVPSDEEQHRPNLIKLASDKADRKCACSLPS
jgi:hypothetical protein